jgi:hypothetical protein
MNRRRVRRFVFWTLLLVAGAYFAWDRIEAAGLARDIARIAARGEPTRAADDNGADLTREQRDAARIYATAVERLQEDTRDEAFRYQRLDVDNPAGAPGSLADLESRFRKDAPSLQLLDQATPLDFAGFGDVAPELSARQDPLAALSALNALRADLLSMRGNGDQAAEALVASVRLLRTMPRSFYRYQASSRLLGSLRILLRHTSPTETALATLQRAFAGTPDADTLTQEMLEARAQFLETIDRPAASVAQAATERLARPWITREWRRQLAIFDESLALTRTPWAARFDLAAAFERKYLADMELSGRTRFITWLTPRRGAAFWVMTMSAAAYDVAGRGIGVALLAVERYRRANGGAGPSTLEALVPAYLAAVPQDPFSGQSLIYRPAADEYRIYSVDNNRKDDGGEFYGIGSRGQLAPRSGAPRDYGIRVPLHPER